MALLLALFLQDDPGRLIDALRSDDVEARLAAQHRLKELGAAAVPALTAASTSSDAETAALSKRLLRLIGLRGSLNPRICASLRDAEERIDKGDGLRLFLDAAGVDGRGRPGRPELTPDDLAVLLPFALQVKPESLKEVWEAVARRRVPAGAPLRDFLSRTEGDDALGDLHAVIAFRPLAEPGDLPMLVRRAWPRGYRAGDETARPAFEARDATLEIAFRLRGRGLVEGSARSFACARKGRAQGPSRSSPSSATAMPPRRSPASPRSPRPP
jgi:hypothetical protein